MFSQLQPGGRMNHKLRGMRWAQGECVGHRGDEGFEKLMHKLNHQ